MSKGGDSNEIKETADQKELMSIALDKFKRYRTTYPDIENKFFDQVQNTDSETNLQAIANEGAANVNSVTSGQAQQAIQSLNQNRVNPNSGQFKQAITGLGDQGAINRADNVSRSQQSLQDARLSGLQSITALGQGQEAQAIQGFGNIAANSQQQAINSGFNSFNRRQGNAQTAATALGAGAAIAMNYDPYGNKEFGYRGVGDPFKSKFDKPGT